MVKMFSNYQISIISHVKISYFYVCSDTTFLGGRNPCKHCSLYNKYIYTDKNDCYIRFTECKSLKEFSSLEQYQFAEDFQRLHTGVKLRCPASFSFQTLSFEYSHYETKK